MGVFGSRPDIRKLEDARDAEGLMKALQYQDAEIRLGAVRALGNFCPEEACEALITCLSDEEARVREASVSALVATGETTLPHLFNAMGNQSRLVRQGAASALKKLRWSPEDDEIRICFLFAQELWEELAGFGKKAIPFLAEGLNDRSPEIRQGSARALGIIRDASGFDPLTRALADQEPDVRGPAALALGELKDPRAIPFLVNLFYDPGAGVRNAAADALAVIGMPAFEPLSSALSDPRTAARLAAIRSLAKIHDPGVIPPLVAKLEDTFPEVRTSAAEALGEMGAPALPRVLEVMKKGSRIARLACLDAFAKNLDDSVTDVLTTAAEGVDEQIAKKAQSVLRKREGLKVWKTSVDEEIEGTAPGSPVELWNIREERKAFQQIASQETERVLAILRDDDRMSRFRSLVRQINEDRPVVEALIMLLKSGDDEIRRRSAEAIDRLEGISGNPFMVALHDTDPFIRSVAARTLGRLGWTDAILPLVHRACEDKDTFVRGAAGEAIITMGMQTGLKLPVTDVLVRALVDDSADVRGECAELLGNVGSATAVPALISLFRDRDTTVIDHAADALAAIGRQAFPPLSQAIYDPDPRVRRGALTALAEFGKKGEACIREGLSDTNPDVRSHAQKVLAALKQPKEQKVRKEPAKPRDVPGGPQAGQPHPPAPPSAAPPARAAAADPGQFIPRLAASEERTRLQAIESLAALGEAAFRPLIFAAYHPDKAMRIGALEALARFGTMGAPWVLKGLEDDEIEVQHAAYRILNRLDGRYGLPKTGGPALSVGRPVPPAETAAPAERLYPADIIPRLGDRNEHVRKRAVEVLVAMGEPAFLPLIYAAYHPEREIRIGALEALVRFGTQGAPYVVRGLQDDDIAVRDAVYRILAEQDGRFGLPKVGGPALTVGTPVPAGVDSGPAAVAGGASVNVDTIRDPEELAGLLDHPEKDVQVNAAMALASRGAAAMPALINAFASRNKETRATAAEIISSFGQDAVEPLMQSLGDTRSDVACGAASVLGRLGDRRAVPALITLLQRGSGGTGPAAAEALGYLGDAASVDALIQALTSPDSDLQSGAARALGYIGDERAISSLIEALGSEDFSLRRIAIDALTGMGDASIPSLSEALLHSDRRVRSGAAECFAQMGYEPKTVQEQINLLVANEEWLEITRRGSSAVDVLIYFVDDANVEVRVGAITALAKVGGPRAAATLAGLLADSDPFVRRKATGLLAGMGRDAVPALLKVRVSAASPAQLEAANQLLGRLEGTAHPGATPR